MAGSSGTTAAIRSACSRKARCSWSSRVLPPVTDEDRYRGLLAGQDYLLSLGVTGWQDAIVGRGFGEDDATDAYRQAASAGTLLANVVGALWWRRHEGLEQLEELLHRRASDGAGRFRPTSVKMMLDGVAENHTAALLDPYLDSHGCATENSGLDFIDPDELPRFVTELDSLGFQVHFHALGDRAVRNALNAIEAARHANKDSAIRHHLAHLQVIHPDDIPRFAALGATANIQPLWATNEAQMTELTIPFLGETRAAWQYPFAALAKTGAHIAGGSDWPVSSPDPLLGAHVAVNRSTPDTATRPFLPEQAISLRTALAAYTAGSARVNGLDNTVGRIKAGHDADFAIVDADLAPSPTTKSAMRPCARPGSAASLPTTARRTDEKTTFVNRGDGRGRRVHAAGLRVRPVAELRHLQRGEYLADREPGQHHPGRRQGSLAGRLGGLPGRQQP